MTHVKWKIWTFHVIFGIILKSQISTANMCTTCEDVCHNAVVLSGNCYCEHHPINEQHDDSRWHLWNRTSRNIKGPSNVLTECFNVVEQSILNPSVCPERSCKYMIFSDSNISTIPTQFFKGVPHLNVIYLNSSEVQSLQLGAFRHLSYLETLQLSDNKLKKILAGTLNFLSSLKILDMHNNEIDEIESFAFYGLDNLEYLDLSRNRLSAISNDFLKPLFNLETLILSRNFLSVVEFNTDQMNNLKSLYLDHNNIVRVEVCIENNTVNLSLFLQNNRISFFNNGSCVMPQVFELNLANNDIRFLDTFNLTLKFGNLKKINVSNNSISKVPIDLFKYSQNLITLDLSQNNITELETGIFNMTKNIQYLNLSSMNLGKIDMHLLIPLTNLKILDISNNKLEFLESKSLDHFEYLEKIVLGGNNFSCENVASIFQQAKKKTVSLVYDTEYTVGNIKGLACTYDIEYKQHSSTNTTNFGSSSMVNWNELRNSLNNFTKTLEENIRDFVTKEKSFKNDLNNEIKRQNNLMKSELNNTLQTAIKTISENIKSEISKTNAQINRKRKICPVSKIIAL